MMGGDKTTREISHCRNFSRVRGGELVYQTVETLGVLAEERDTRGPVQEESCITEEES